jgi:uracil-DNA glycosylase
MNKELSEQLEAWIQFFRDLGITDFYRREPSFGREIVEFGAQGLTPSGTSAFSNQSQAVPVNWDATRAGGASVPSTERVPVPQAPHLAPAPKPEPQVSIRPPARSLTLFETNAQTEPAKPETLGEIREDLGDCQRCKLWSGRKHIVFGQGNPHAELVFVGEGPGADEDEQGLPFVGRAGQLLNRMLQLNSIRREDVYICNVIKCRPPGNRTPETDEIAACSPFLFRQIQAIQPRVVCCLGAPATRTVLGIKEGITKLHGRWFTYGGARAMVTVHPAYVLRNPREETILREDFEKIRDFLRSPRQASPGVEASSHPR